MSSCPSVRSPVDEDGVHDSFNQLIAEQSQNGVVSDAYELQELQRELEEGRGTVCLERISQWLSDFFCRALLWRKKNFQSPPHCLNKTATKWVKFNFSFKIKSCAITFLEH